MYDLNMENLPADSNSLILKLITSKGCILVAQHVSTKKEIGFMNSKIDEICGLRQCEYVKVPKLEEKSGKAIANPPEEYVGIRWCKYLIIEGDFAMAERSDLIIYMHVVDDKLRLHNRLDRDLKYRNYKNTTEIESNFTKNQEAQHLKYTLPVAAKADILLIASLVQNDYAFEIYQKN